MSDNFDAIIRQVLAQAQPNLLQDELDQMNTDELTDVKPNTAQVPPDKMIDAPVVILDENPGDETRSPIYPANPYPRGHTAYPVGVEDDVNVMLDAIKRRQLLGRQGS
jgi:hypothetical protein